MTRSASASAQAGLLPHHQIEPTATIRRKLAAVLWTATVVLVRHAERGAGADPALTPAGQARAALLARMLQDANLSAVFVTDTTRSRQTGGPAAQGAGLQPTLYNATDAAGLVAAIRAGHAGRTVLVVAHSNTVDDIAAALGAPGLAELADSQFDRLFVLTRSWCATRLLRLSYGTPTP
ncbi:phosphoglycerate mutase family protein [Rhodobacter calidifons]|uniref:Histidine phosphatase family protein n=1 Tax=Rhodobacter calidifons TaxID=2715277 RepID=A0ABX0G565_9RHOB|nr:phosphoglycerate mutase family protein [Rhodobacter calidifons]NHB75989.1 histidine phosphatase family protein [Rhodobacter calidifons]